MIYETVVTTMNPDGSVHIAPMGVRSNEAGEYLIAPFSPSITLDNLAAAGAAVLNAADDVMIFAGCLTGRRQWPTVKARFIDCERLEDALAHVEVRVQRRLEEDAARPVFVCTAVHAVSHRPFRGFNRAQAAVVEAAILASRLHLLPEEKVRTELAYLGIAVNKTAGEKERTAWGWLLEKIEDYYGTGTAP